MDDIEELPDRGTTHYLEHLRHGRRNILENSENPALTAEQRETLRDVVVLWGQVETAWDLVERASRCLPSTLVHGDFTSTNVRVRASGGVLEIVPLDWENAGRGTPAIDLLRVDLDLYASLVRAAWPSVERGAVQSTYAAGRVHWCLAAVDWQTSMLAHPWIERPLAKIESYLEWMRDYLAAVAAAPTPREQA